MNPFRIHFSLFDQAFTIGPYTIFFFLALATVVIGGIIFAARRGFDRKKVTIIMLVMLVSSVVGARLLNALVNFPAYWENPAKLFAFDASGFSLYGGIAMAIISGLISCHFLRLNIFKLGDTLIPFLGIGIGIMRIGCFMNGCCFGKETDLPWGVHFPFLSPAHLYQLSNGGSFLEVDGVHPTQLYELVAAFSGRHDNANILDGIFTLSINQFISQSKSRHFFSFSILLSRDIFAYYCCLQHFIHSQQTKNSGSSNIISQNYKTYWPSAKIIFPSAPAESTTGKRST